jgi:hypothetical protein
MRKTQRHEKLINDRVILESKLHILMNLFAVCIVILFCLE